MVSHTIVDAIQINGWTPALVQRAVSVLSAMTARQSGDENDPERQLAAELVRRLVGAVQDDPCAFVDYLDDAKSMGATASAWEKLDELLYKDQPLAELVTCLREGYADPVPALCTLLHIAVPKDADWDAISEAHQRAIAVLLFLGTAESLACLFANVSLLCWEQAEPYGSLVRRQAAAFTEAAIAAWPGLDWIDRSTIVLLFCECDLDMRPLSDLLVAADTGSMDYETRRHFVYALAYSGDLRAHDLIRAQIDLALDDIAMSRSEQAIHFFDVAVHDLVLEVGSRLTTAQHERASELGLTIPGERLTVTSH